MDTVHITFGNAFSSSPSRGYDVEAGTTVREFLQNRNVEPSNARIRLNRESANLDVELCDGDYLTAEPSNIKNG